MGPGVFIPITLFACVFGIFYLYYSTRNRERMALIEKGESADLLAVSRNRLRNNFWPLRVGILLVGLGAGIILGEMLHRAFHSEEAAYFSMLFLCGGVALIIAFFIERVIIQKSIEDQV